MLPEIPNFFQAKTSLTIIKKVCLLFIFAITPLNITQIDRIDLLTSYYSILTKSIRVTGPDTASQKKPPVFGQFFIT